MKALKEVLLIVLAAILENLNLNEEKNVFIDSYTTNYITLQVLSAPIILYNSHCIGTWKEVVYAL